MKTFTITLCGALLFCVFGLILNGFQHSDDLPYFVIFFVVVGIPAALIFSLIVALTKKASVEVSKMPQPTQDKVLKPFRFFDKYRMVILVVLGLFILIMFAVVVLTQ